MMQGETDRKIQEAAKYGLAHLINGVKYLVIRPDIGRWVALATALLALLFLLARLLVLAGLAIAVSLFVTVVLVASRFFLAESVALAKRILGDSRRMLTGAPAISRSRLAEIRAAVEEARTDNPIAPGRLETRDRVPSDSSRQTESTNDITVVVPAYNEEKHLRDALESVRRQSFEGWKCVIVDDTSTDGTPAICEEFAHSDNRFIVIRHQSNSGLSASRNTGLRQAGTPYITFLDGDDFLLPDSLQSRLHVLQEQPADVAGAFCQMMPVSEEATLNYRAPTGVYETGTKSFLNCAGDCPFNAHAPLLRRSVVVDFDGFDETMKDGAEDWDLWQRMMRNGYSFVPTKRFGAAYRRKSGSMVNRTPHLHLNEARRIHASVYEPIVESAICPNSPYVYSQPVQFYQNAVAMTKRTLQYLALSYFSKRKDVFEAALAHLEPDSYFYCSRHLELRVWIEAGIYRALALGPSGVSDADLQGDIDSIVDDIEYHAIEYMSRPISRDNDDVKIAM